MASPLVESLENRFQISNVARLGKHSAGVYLFHDSVTVFQCGSSVGWQRRLQLHYQESRRRGKEPKPFYRDANDSSYKGLSKYHFTPVYVQPNWYSLFPHLYHDASAEEMYIVRSFTQQAVRSLEQSIATYTQPHYFDGKDILLSHLP